MHRAALLLGLLMVLQAGAQTPQEVLAKMNKTMLGATSYQMQVEALVYKKESDATPYFKCAGQTVKSGDKVYVDMMDRVTIAGKESMILVDKRQKLIIYKTLEKPLGNPLGGVSSLNMDSLMQANAKTAVFTQNDADQKVIYFAPKGGDITTISVTVDAKKYTICKVVYTFVNTMEANASTSKVVVNYNQVKLNAPVSETVFDQKKYIAVNGNIVKPVGAYKSFKVINQNDNRIK